MATAIAEVQRAPIASQPQEIPGRRATLELPPPSSVAFSPASSASKLRKSHLQIDTFSPVNQNGSFEFDRVLKSGFVQKRTRKTKVEEAIIGKGEFQLTNDHKGLEADISRSAA